MEEDKLFEEHQEEHQKKKKTQTIVWVIVIGCVVLLVVFWSKIMYSNYDQTLFIVAEAQNMDCPQKIDEITQLDSVTLRPGRKLCYHLTLQTFVKDSVESDYCERLRASITENLEGDPTLEDFAKNDVTIVYTHGDKYGELICTTTLTPGQYFPKEGESKD